MCIRQMASRHLWVIVVCGWVWPMRDAHRQKCHWPTAEHREVHLLLVHILDSNILVLAHVAQTINEDTNQNALNLHPSNESTADIQCNQYKGIIHTTHTHKACNPFAYKMKMMMKWCEMMWNEKKHSSFVLQSNAICNDSICYSPSQWYVNRPSSYDVLENGRPAINRLRVEPFYISNNHWLLLLISLLSRMNVWFNRFYLTLD